MRSDAPASRRPSDSEDRRREKLEPEWLLLFAAWGVAAAATAGSLFFSYVMGFAPCVLCWYER